MNDNEREIRRFRARVRRNAGKHARGEGDLDPITWRDINAMLLTGLVEGVPAGIDLEEFLWQTIPRSRQDVEARNPGRAFEPAPWAEKIRKKEDE